MLNEYTHVGEMTPFEVPEGEGSSVILGQLPKLAAVV